MPLGNRFEFTGQFYRGRALGGIGGGIGQSVLWERSLLDPTTEVYGLNSMGGWAQLKFQATAKIEFNGVFADDNAFAGDARGFATDQNNLGEIFGRNRGALANVVFRPRSDLLLAAELRRLRTFPVYSNSSVTNQVNLSIGILF